MPKNIVFFGGTFDPIHKGHLLIAELADKTVQPEKLYFIPCKTPVHKAQAQASDHDRCQMIQDAIGKHAHYQLDRIEIERSEPSYTILTVEHYQKQFPEHTLFWLIGADALNAFQTWHRWQDILKTCHLLVVDRPESPLTTSIPTYSSYDDSIFAKQTGLVLHIKTPGIAISSTEIRSHFWQHPEKNEHLLECTRKYILENKLYVKNS